MRVSKIINNRELETSRVFHRQEANPFSVSNVAGVELQTVAVTVCTRYVGGSAAVNTKLNAIAITLDETINTTIVIITVDIHIFIGVLLVVGLHAFVQQRIQTHQEQHVDHQQ